MYLHTEIPLQCPFCHKDDTVDDASEDRKFCLEKLSDGTNRLKKTHTYFTKYVYSTLTVRYIVSYTLSKLNYGKCCISILHSCRCKPSFCVQEVGTVILL